ncbi:unnamed protein product [Effrenium voratum]|nr:unnamed protein product [Effrenium voratum]
MRLLFAFVKERCVEEHRDNWDLMAAAGSIEAIDDPVSLNSGETMTCENLEIFSNPLPSLKEEAVLPALAANQLPVLLISGWSCVTSGTACSAFSALKSKHWRLLVGPWNHGGVQHVRYCRETKLLKFPKDKAVQEFLLHHMPPRSSALLATSPPSWLASSQPEAHFYMCGSAPAWQHSTQWPPQGVVKRPLWLLERSLAWAKEELGDEGSTQLPPATSARQLVWGGVSRYMAMIKMMDLVKYKWKQSAVDSGRALLFEAPACSAPLALVGSAVLSLRIRGAGDPDADIFAYICERPADGGDLTYVTEGILRLSYRKEVDAPPHEKAADPPQDSEAEADARVPHHSYRRQDREMVTAEGTTARLKFFPAAYRFRAGSKIALVIAPDDATHYVPNPLAASNPPFICHSRAEPSALWLPLQEDAAAL